MNVTPMNMQMMFPQANEASQVQHNLNQAGALQQSFEDVRQKEDAKLKQKQVRNKDNPEDGKINRDGHNGQGAYFADGKRRPEQEEEDELREKLAHDPARGNFLDISY